MAPFAPFEGRPALAVAVSGGRDSCCLLDVAVTLRGAGAAYMLSIYGLSYNPTDEVSRLIAGQEAQALTGTTQGEILNPVLSSEDAREGAAAFAEKRDPVWQGR